ncbi:Rz1-like lysis system protein LysC [Pantoea sp. Mb-10]|uniref:Rz1-like lysis system protein LysC n=1 Tax=unclassified Pantoea TaxID=2630326 RepID=UPI001E3E00F7|nr:MULTISPECIES: Rz1-like lysis system protein LysC [unclassified Pantoea]MCE0489962.1 Rz1-like lysis system protein LysC [Pantoea sp. Mb-10]MCE0500931.1 Rz1-like lysis system protein LysC [Pantoea sp. Pb-8]
MRIRFYVRGLLPLCLLTLSACTAVPPSPAPEIIWIGCPRVTSCPIPGNNLRSQGDLVADNRQLEAALVACGLQIDIIKECQEQHDAETPTTSSEAARQRTAAAGPSR